MADMEPKGAIHPAPREFTEQQISDDPILRYFHYRHLPPMLQEVSAPFCGLAHMIVTTLPRNPERTVALRKLLEGKDAAVRANVLAAAHKDSFLDRLHQEHCDLLGRLGKLNTFLDTIQFFALPQEQQDLLREQAVSMNDYQSILERRIKLVEATQPEHVRRDHGQDEGEREPVITGRHHDEPPPFNP